MKREMYWKIYQMSLEKNFQERSIAYLAEHLERFLRKRERVMICFPEYTEGNLAWLMEQAVLRCDAFPVIWGPDHTWKALLRQTFSEKTSALIGPPLIVLGLSKLKKYYSTPLYIRKVIAAGYPCPEWMIEGISQGLDCEVGGCFSIGESGPVAGFACGRSWGVHIREDAYGIDIVDREGNPQPPGKEGDIVIFPRTDPALRYAMAEQACLETAPCRCGSQSSRLLNFRMGSCADPDLTTLGQQLLSWTSILDCRLEKGESGLEIEIVCFPGEQLPKLPTAAKLVIRPWNPAMDAPFPYAPALKT